MRTVKDWVIVVALCVGIALAGTYALKEIDRIIQQEACRAARG